MIAILEKLKEEIDAGYFDEMLDEELPDEVAFRADASDVQNLIDFIKQNSVAIDAEADGTIKMKYANGEDGYAYFQSITCKNRKGKLTKWPCADGWNMQNGGGYEKIQEFNAKMVDGEFQELMDVAYDTIYDIIWDDESLENAMEKTGAAVEEFEVPMLSTDTEESLEKKLNLETIEPTNVAWIRDALFVFTGLSDSDESFASNIVKSNGGVIKSSVVLKTNYVVYNPDYPHETTKLRRAKELIAAGKPIQLLMVSEFCEKLISE